MLLPLNMLLFGVNPPAGMDWSVIGHHAMLARKSAEPCAPPIQVTVEGEYWRVTDGRHRVLGWLIGGRTHIDATITEGVS